MKHANLRPLIALVLVAGAVLAFFLIQGPRTEETEEQGRPPIEVPPTTEDLAARLAADLPGYEAHRDLALGLATPSVTLQSDFFAWGRSEQRTEMQPGRWWAPGEVWYDTQTVLESVGLDAEAFDGLKSFLRGEALLAIRKIQRSERGEAWIELPPRQGMHNPYVQRLLVWHADPAPRTSESVRWFSEEKQYPQHMRETALPVAGWFVRETLVDRPR